MTIARTTLENMAVGTTLTAACDAAAVGIAKPGDWLSAGARIAVWQGSRTAMTNELDLRRRRAISPFAVDGAHGAVEELPAAAVEVVHRLATDPGRLTKPWAETQIDALGEETYTELIAVTSIAIVIDRFDEALGRTLRPLPEPQSGAPTRERPADVGDVGAWVSQALHKIRANVSRALTLVPETQQVWRSLVDTFYSRGGEFLELEWNRALSRPQVELVAARTTSLNECFY